MADTVLRIENDAQLITSTNFWATEMARAGKFFLSTNAGAFRLLVPQQHLSAVRDMRAAHTVMDAIADREPYPASSARVSCFIPCALRKYCTFAPILRANGFGGFSVRTMPLLPINDIAQTTYL